MFTMLNNNKNNNTPFWEKDAARKNKGWRNFFRVGLILILLAVSFAAGMYISGRNELTGKLAYNEAVYLGQVLGKYSQPPGEKLSEDIDFNLFWKVWDTLNDMYVGQEELQDKKLFYGALRGMVASLGDPYTVFMDPKITMEFENDLARTFEGIGAEIGIRNDILTVIAPLAGTPADKAGLLAGDKILAIDGESTAGIGVDEAVNKIRGPKGTEVTLTIGREDDDIKDIIIARGTIIVKSVNTDRANINGQSATGDEDQAEIPDNIFIVEISNFNNDTLQLFNQAVNDILETNPAGIILDLRNNPGGYLDTAVEVASEWIEEGIVVTEQFSDGNKNEYLARGRARLKDYPTIVLVNQGSASASEIVAGALQDYKLATIVGKKTFGKGSVQSLEEFFDGSSLKVTVAEWLTPLSRSINKEGIMPDIEIDRTAEDYNNNEDPQKDKALEILAGGGAENNN